jgi:short-subunit dehydrogenase
MVFINNKINKYESKKVVIIISISSDIGYALAKQYSELGYKIIGTYRSETLLEEIKKIPNCHLFYCDISNKSSISEFINNFKNLGIKWDLIISCPCNPLPLKPFFECNFEEWENSINLNSIDQLSLLHGLYNFRNKEKVPSVVFFSGAGSNSTVINLSAYSVSKIMLMKICELLDAENKDLKIFIVGPGWVKTKIHNKMLNTLDKDSQKYKEIKEFIENKKGTDMKDIFECIRWLEEQEKEIVGGRNFSVVNDGWKGEREEKLIKELKSDKNMYKLRRYKNEFLANKENK